MQQQGLVAPRWCKNLAERCFREGTGNDVRKYIIRSRLSNVTDCCDKCPLAQAGIDTRAPFFSYQIRFRPISVICVAYSQCMSVRLLLVSEYRSLTLYVRDKMLFPKGVRYRGVPLYSVSRQPQLQLTGHTSLQ